MNQTRWVWLGFAGALLLVLAVMVFFSVKVLDYETSAAKAEQRAALEENVRLALWRMDSAAAVMFEEARADLPPRNLKGDGSDIAATQQSIPVQTAQNDSQSQFLNRAQRQAPEYQSNLSQQEFGQRFFLNSRRSTSANRQSQQWPKFAPELLAKISDLFPNAKLEPAVDAKPGQTTFALVDPRRLASIPARLVIPEDKQPLEPLPWNTPIRVSLMVAWACLVIAAAAAALLLRAVLALSERRAAFVSTVTHELRTPLTTFRMYAEMLADGMVSDSATRAEYLQTLVTESDRLGRLIENVLAYARLERQLSPSHAKHIGVSELLERSIPGLERRAQQAGLKLHADIARECENLSCQTDTIAVHQVLLNLVDNACKYGKTDVQLTARRHDGQLQITISDQGPGLPKQQSDRLFQAFSKARDDTAPGIGLGLHLSRRLARDLKGDLRHQPTDRGATFVFTLPLAT